MVQVDRPLRAVVSDRVALDAGASGRERDVRVQTPTIASLNGHRVRVGPQPCSDKPSVNAIREHRIGTDGVDVNGGMEQAATAGRLPGKGGYARDDRGRFDHPTLTGIDEHEPKIAEVVGDGGVEERPRRSHARQPFDECPVAGDRVLERTTSTLSSRGARSLWGTTSVTVDGAVSMTPCRYSAVSAVLAALRPAASKAALMRLRASGCMPGTR